MTEPKPEKTSAEKPKSTRRLQLEAEGVKITTFAEMMAKIGYDVNEGETISIIGARPSTARHPEPQEKDEKLLEE